MCCPQPHTARTSPAATAPPSPSIVCKWRCINRPRRRVHPTAKRRPAAHSMDKLPCGAPSPAHALSRSTNRAVHQTSGHRCLPRRFGPRPLSIRSCWAGPLCAEKGPSFSVPIDAMPAPLPRRLPQQNLQQQQQQQLVLTARQRRSTTHSPVDRSAI